MPGDFGVLVVTRVLFTTTKCTRDRGCIVRPAFPTPSSGKGFLQSSGASRRGTKTRVEIEARTSQPIVPANAGIHNHRMSLLCRGVSAVFQFQRHGVWVPAFEVVKYISDLILRSAPWRASRTMATSPYVVSILRDACFASSSSDNGEAVAQG